MFPSIAALHSLCARQFDQPLNLSPSATRLASVPTTPFSGLATASLALARPSHTPP